MGGPVTLRPHMSTYDDSLPEPLCDQGTQCGSDCVVHIPAEEQTTLSALHMVAIGNKDNYEYTVFNSAVTARIVNIVFIKVSFHQIDAQSAVNKGCHLSDVVRSRWHQGRHTFHTSCNDMNKMEFFS